MYHKLDDPYQFNQMTPQSVNNGLSLILVKGHLTCYLHGYGLTIYALYMLLFSEIVEIHKLTNQTNLFSVCIIFASIMFYCLLIYVLVFVCVSSGQIFGPH